MANIDYDDFKGKLGVGRVHSGSLRKGQTVGLGRPEQDVKTGKVAELFVFDNLGRTVRSIDPHAEDEPGLDEVRLPTSFMEESALRFLSSLERKTFATNVFIDPTK